MTVDYLEPTKTAENIIVQPQDTGKVFWQISKLICEESSNFQTEGTT